MKQASKAPLDGGELGSWLHLYLHGDVFKDAEGAFEHLENKGVRLTSPKHLVNLSASYAFRQGMLDSLLLDLSDTMQIERTLHTSLIKITNFPDIRHGTHVRSMI